MIPENREWFTEASSRRHDSDKWPVLATLTGNEMRFQPQEKSGRNAIVSPSLIAVSHGIISSLMIPDFTACGVVCCHRISVDIAE